MSIPSDPVHLRGQAKVEDDRVWITNEKMLEAFVHELTAERDFLREVVKALTSNQERSPASEPEGT